MLESSGDIRGDTVLTDTARSSDGLVNIVVQVTLERQTEDYLSRFEHAVRQCPEVRECFLMTGSTDYRLRVETPSVAAYEILHGDILSRMPGVIRINSSFAICDALRPRITKR